MDTLFFFTCSKLPCSLQTPSSTQTQHLAFGHQFQAFAHITSPCLWCLPFTFLKNLLFSQAPFQHCLQGQSHNTFPDSFLTAQRKQHASLAFVIKNDWPLSWWEGMGVSSGSFLSREVEFSLPVHTENDYPDSLPRLAVSHLVF